MVRGKALFFGMTVVLACLMALGGRFASAAGAVVVTPSNPGGWNMADTRPGGAVNFVADSIAPSGAGALQLTTDATTTSKAQYIHDASGSLVDVSDLSYYAKQNAANIPEGDASYQLLINANGPAGGFTTLVYEPYWNGTVLAGAWQSWDVDAGQFWSSRSVTCSNGALVAGAGGPPLYTLDQEKMAYPEAEVLGFGVNVGSNNPSYDVEVDLVNFNGTVYDFELDAPTPTPTPSVRLPESKDACKDGGWQGLTRDDGSLFKNQGDCIQLVNTGK